jgi:hypothetical protein
MAKSRKMPSDQRLTIAIRNMLGTSASTTSFNTASATPYIQRTAQSVPIYTTDGLSSTRLHFPATIASERSLSITSPSSLGTSYISRTPPFRLSFHLCVSRCTGAFPVGSSVERDSSEWSRVRSAAVVLRGFVNLPLSARAALCHWRACRLQALRDPRSFLVGEW